MNGVKTGYVYSITSPNTNKIYIGSTNNVIKRWHGHLRNFRNNLGTTSKFVIEHTEAKINILETLTYHDKKELQKRERHHIIQNINNCVNMHQPTRTHKEYYQDNKDIINSKSNSVELCNICNKTYTKRNKARHYKLYCKLKTKESNLLLLILIFYYLIV
jgi:predicted GIY-YIG superfamily endonuclease